MNLLTVINNIALFIIKVVVEFGMIWIVCEIHYDYKEWRKHRRMKTIIEALEMLKGDEEDD